MITDRTYGDVRLADDIWENKVKTFQELTENDLSTLERGRLTLSTLNRIETKQVELCSTLDYMMYRFEHSHHKEWSENDIFKIEDFSLWFNNLDNMIDGYYVYESTPSVLMIDYTYGTLNKIEQILVDIELMISDMKSKYRECGDVVCGEG